MASTQPASSARRPGSSSRYRLVGDRLLVARLLWLLVTALDVTLFALATPISLGTEDWIGGTKYLVALAELGLSPSFYAV